jgi:kynurenine formamidase
MGFIDLSHVIEDGLVTYPGLPAPVISDHLSREASRGHYASGTTFHIARIAMVGNTGTYIDAPSHRYESGADIAGLRLDQIANLEGLVIDVTSAGRAIDIAHVGSRAVRGLAVLLYTGWSSRFGTAAYGEGHPYLTRDAAAMLASAGAALVGIDSLNIDDIAATDRPAHSVLLGSGIPIVEHLTALGELPAEGFRFFAVAPRVKGMGSFPVRAFAVV